MKSGWNNSPLGAAFETLTGSTPPKNNPDLYGRFIPLVKPPELCDAALDSAEDGLSEAGADVARTAPPNSILVSCIGNLGKVGLNTVPVAFNQQINAILPNESKAIPEFMFYQVLSSSFKDQLAALASGTTIPIVNKSKFNNIEIVLPPLQEQQFIVSILDEAFDGIATAKANAEKNLQNARALFESHLQSVFSQRGEGWVEKTLEDVCQRITDGKHGDCKDEAGSGFYFLSAKDVRGGTLNYEAARQITKPDFNETHRRTNLEPGDILITNSGTIGRMAIAPLDDRTRRTTFQKSVAILKPIRVAIDSRFAFYCLSAGLSRFANLSAGTAQKNLLLRDLRSYRFALPKSIDHQQMVAMRFDKLSAETQHLESIYQQKLAALDALKKSLLHQAFSGHL